MRYEEWKVVFLHQIFFSSLNPADFPRCSFPSSSALRYCIFTINALTEQQFLSLSVQILNFLNLKYQIAFKIVLSISLYFQMMLVVKNLPTFLGNVREEGLTPGSWRSPGGGHGNPLQYSCLENPIDRGAGWATEHRVTKSWTQIKWLTYTHAI